MDSSEVKVYENNSFGKLSVKMVGDEIFIRLKDISEALDLDPSKIRKRLDKDGVLDQAELNSNGIYSPTVYISEPNFYLCVLQSKKDSAKKFQSWVTKEVLPSIRKHGAYITKEKLVEIYNDPREMAKLFTELADERDLRIATQKKLEEVEPKAEYYDKILDRKDLLNVTSISKSLGLTAQSLNKILLKLGVIMGLDKKKTAYGLTYRYCNGGYGNVKDVPIFDKEGNIKFYKKLLVYTEKGKELICKLLLEKGFIKTNEDGSITPNENKILDFLKEPEDED